MDRVRYRCSCGGPKSDRQWVRCYRCAQALIHQVPPGPRSDLDNILKAAFRAAVGFDPFRDGVPPGVLFPRKVRHDRPATERPRETEGIPGP